MALPSGWTTTAEERPTALGPQGSALTASSWHVSGEGSENEAAEVAAQVEENGLSAMHATVDEFGLTVVAPLSSTRLSDNVTMRWQIAESKSAFVAQYLLVSKRTIALLTHEGPISAKGEIDRVREAISSVRWAD